MEAPVVQKDFLRRSRKIVLFDRHSKATIPAETYWALVSDKQGEIIGVCHSKRNGIPSNYTPNQLDIKQYCPGQRPFILFPKLSLAEEIGLEAKTRRK